MRDKIKHWLGIDQTSPSVKKYFESANVRSSIYMAIIVAALESYMIIWLFSYLHGDVTRSFSWIVTHLISYIILFVTAAVVMIYGDHFLHSSVKDRRTGKVALVVFSAICIIFGIYISTGDYERGEQILTFITMAMFVVGLLTWKPITSFFALTASFIAMYICMRHVSHVSFADNVNYFTLWVAMMATAYSNYHQRRSEAEKEERLIETNEHFKRMTAVDDLTGVASMRFFRVSAEGILKEQDVKPEDRSFLFLDIENFKAYNEKFGFDMGNAFLIDYAKKLQEIFDGSLVARQADDHFVVLTDKAGVEEKAAEMTSWVYGYSDSAQIGLKVGAYSPTDDSIDPNMACDYARYACNSIKKRYDQDFKEYDKSLDDEFKLRQYIVNNVDTALDNGHLRIQYQPVVWAKNRKLCGYEALAKWQDPEMGNIPPGIFIPILEEYRQVHKLDMVVVETVCSDLRMLMDGKKPTVPVSLNFSRLDFELTDVVSILESCVSRYNIPRNYLHVEVTESALSEGAGTLRDDLQRLRDLGYPLWLDDFGSGYSSLNVLKDYQFDVMKIDMKFLSGFSDLATKSKSKAVLNNVVRMAKDLGMRTLTEGVETPEQADYLREIGCERLQGYLFGKAMPLERAQVKIAAGTLVVADEYLGDAST